MRESLGEEGRPLVAERYSARVVAPKGARILEEAVR